MMAHFTLNSIEINNLFSYQSANIELSNGITVIAGQNGSGKSSLLECIFFALYGSKAKATIDRKLDDILRIGTDYGYVNLKFTHADHSYAVQMALKRKIDSVGSDKENCFLERNDGQKWVGVEVVTEEIEKLLGLNKDDFTNCVYIRQGEIDTLISATGDERRKMIDRLLRLERLDQYATRAKEGGKRAVNRRLDLLGQKSLDTSKEIQQLESQNLENILANLKVQIANSKVKVEELGQLILKVELIQKSVQQKKEFEVELGQKQKLFSTTETNSSKLSERIRVLRLEVNKYSTNATIESLGNSLEALTRERDELRTKITQDRTKLAGLNELLSNSLFLISKGQCPTCEQAIAGNSLQDKVQTFQDQIKLLGTGIVERTKTLEEYDAKIKETKANYDELQKVSLFTIELNDKQETYNTQIETLATLKGEIDKLQAKIGELTIDPNTPDLAQLKREKDTLQNQVDSAIREEGSVQTKIERLSTLQTTSEEIKLQLAEYESLKTEVEELIGLYELLKKSLRKQNIETLELYFNEFFHAMDSGQTYRGIQVNDEYEIKVQLLDGSTISPDLLSGGERALINIALRSAIHQVLAQATTRLPLILDEPTVFLDREKVGRLQLLIEKLGSKIGQVILVSHEVGLVDAGQNEYRTEKGSDNISRIVKVR